MQVYSQYVFIYMASDSRDDTLFDQYILKTDGLFNFSPFLIYTTWR